MNKTQQTTPAVPPCAFARLTAWTAILAFSAAGLVGCKSRLFSFGEEPTIRGNQPSTSDQSPSGQIAIGQQTNPGPGSGSGAQKNENAVAAPYVPLQGSQKKLLLGSTQRFEVNGQQVDVTFEQVLEDSRCPKDVVCVWEGQAKLQFSLNVPALGLSRKVTPTLRVGHPELGQAIVGSIGLDLVGLSPDTVSTGQKAQSPEATVVVGKAP